MRKFTLIILSSILLFFTQQVLADDANMIRPSEGKACKVIAQACLDAGYGENADKKFWQDCMKPLLYGNKVAGITIHPNILNTCRRDKVNELQQELKAIQNAIQN